MKQLLFFLLGLFLLAGCKDKKDDPSPKNPAEAIAGLYTMTSITYSGVTVSLPFSGNGRSLSGTINVTTVSGKQDEANMTVTLKQSGLPDETGDGLVQVKAAGNGYELFENGQKVGSADGNTLTLMDGNDVIIAKK